MKSTAYAPAPQTSLWLIDAHGTVERIKLIHFMCGFTCMERVELISRTVIAPPKTVNKLDVLALILCYYSAKLTRPIKIL